MSTLEIYNRHLESQFEEGKPFMENAIYKPETDAVPLVGVFDDTTRRANKDAGNVQQYQSITRFLLHESDSLNIDIYKDEKIYLVNRDKTFVIEFVDRDANGVQALWLR